MQYTLSKETTDYLTQPTFDMWHWEPNEVRTHSAVKLRTIAFRLSSVIVRYLQFNPL